MTNKVCANLFSKSEDEAILLEAWLNERDAFRQTANLNIISNTTQDNERLSRAYIEYDGEIKPGQIRILSKRFVDNPDIVPYVLVVDKWLSDMWIIMPFSPYSYPATSLEMATMNAPIGQRVLQAWNSRTVHNFLLQKSFLAGTIDEKVRYEAHALFLHTFLGKDLPSDFSAIRGGVIISSLDPRRDYQLEFINQFTPLLTSTQAWEAKLARLEVSFKEEPLIMTMPSPQHYREALAAGSEIQETQTYKINDFSLDVKIVPSEAQAYFSIYDTAGNQTTACDGFCIISKTGNIVAEIVGGRAIVAIGDINEGFAIIDQNEKVLTIKTEA